MTMFNQTAAKNHMRRIVADHRDPITDEVNYTSLAEATAAHFGVEGVGGPLDDEGHWIWEIALEVG